MGLEETQQRKEIKKHIATIHCANTLSLLQRKISNALLFHAYPKLMKEEEHYISVKQLCQTIEYVGHNYSVVKDALKELLATVIEWDLVDENTGEEDWTASSILASVRIKGSNCWYAYSPRMRELLHSPSVYARINLIVQAKFKSGYGLALYENCVRYQNITYTKWFKLEVFRKLMGVPPETYKIFRDFKRRVLDKAIEEVNYYSELYVIPEIERVGHRVTKIRFRLNEKQKKKWLGSESKSISDIKAVVSIQSSEILNQLIHTFKMEQTKANEILNTYELKKIENKINYIKSTKAYTNGTITNIAGYLLQALKDDYHSTNNLEIAAEKGRAEYEENLRLKEEQRRADIRQKQYNDYVLQELDNALNAMDKEQYQQLFDQFENTLKIKSFLHYQKFKSEGLKNKVVKIFLKEFINEKYPECLSSLMSYSEFDATK